MSRSIASTHAMPLSEVQQLLQPESGYRIQAGCFRSSSTQQVDVPQQTYGEGNGIKNFFKRWPRLYGVFIVIIGPSLFTGLTSKRFAATLPDDAKILHAGSGTRSFGSRCVNVDVFAFPNVQVIADLADLPFQDGVFDAVTCDQVLEHVADAHRVAVELKRVTKPGGLIHIACPFVFPWHPSPSDFSRWTFQGQASLFPDCLIVKQGVTAGPFSALTALLAYIGALIFSLGIQRIRTLLEFVFLTILAPLKLIDLVAARIPGADVSAANLYSVFQVPSQHE